MCTWRDLRKSQGLIVIIKRFFAVLRKRGEEKLNRNWQFPSVCDNWSLPTSWRTPPPFFSWIIDPSSWEHLLSSSFRLKDEEVSFHTILSQMGASSCEIGHGRARVLYSQGYILLLTQATWTRSSFNARCNLCLLRSKLDP